MRTPGKPTPTGEEIQFDFDELFFSKTDPHGIILYGNDVFVRISGYRRETMIGAPHNIIRHPGMPRCVFKVLWATIQAGQPIVAYVKNLNADGKYYWVLAAAFPVTGGYLSIRLKPSTDLFAQVQAIYEKVLAAEKAGGMDEGQKLLLEIIREAGFSNYPSFMTAALSAELKARDTALASSSPRTHSSIRSENGQTREAIRRVRDISATGSRRFRELFARVDEFERAQKVFDERTASVLSRFRHFRLISLNLGVSASRFGQTGATMAVVARDFQGLAQEIETHLKSFAEAVKSLREGMRDCLFHLGALKLQMEMVDFFVRESLEKTLTGGMRLADAFEPLEANHREFLEVTRHSGDLSKSRLSELGSSLRRFVTATEEIKTFVNGLEVISQLGAVETARISAHEALGSYIGQMNEFSRTLRTASTDILSATRTLAESVGSLHEQVFTLSGTLEAIFEVAFSLRDLAPPTHEAHAPATEATAALG